MGCPPGAGDPQCRALRRGDAGAMITLVLGGARSGKSQVAEQLASRLPPPVTYVATVIVREDDHDEDLARRVAAHRERRPAAWSTVDAGHDLVAAVHAVDRGTVLIDSVGPWVAAQPDFAVDAGALVRALAGLGGDAVIVSEEVGL